MKYCRYCGSEIADEAVVCVHCGRLVDVQPAPAQNSRTLNVLCLLGFIFSFFVSIAGLVLSIKGYKQVKKTDDSKSRTFAVAGIIISSVSLALTVLAYLLLIYMAVIMSAIGSMLWMA